MITRLRRPEGFDGALLDALPQAVLVVDDDVRVLDFNRAAQGLLGASHSRVFKRRGGDALHCVHADESPEGCGRAPACKHCMLRQSVAQAYRDGVSVRHKARMELVREGTITHLYLLVIATPFDHVGERRVILILEDISELVEMGADLPICAYCKKIRAEEGEGWNRLESYFKAHWDLEFTHSICPDCLKLHHPEVARAGGKDAPA